ncbi:hypothetical protein LK996_15985 [Lysobacter sp. A6]|uniref:Uncharacterized protein n=1 Tax=Noviluteimonas lactosilytica TaxID=2888523 RepID=A0ABS8JLX9_9GAMM|nr:hypothetical protein [Lysobacter lactosilyticus]MCC8364572.1 hypothetical protein [Lysobacter lactosilyticus]
MKGFRVDWMFPGESDFLAGEIRFEGQVFCRVRCERADGLLEVDFPAGFVKPIYDLPLTQFLRLVEAVGDEVRDLRCGASIPAAAYPICFRGMGHAVNDA